MFSKHPLNRTRYLVMTWGNLGMTISNTCSYRYVAPLCPSAQEPSCCTQSTNMRNHYGENSKHHVNVPQ